MGAVELEVGGRLAPVPQVRFLFTICKATYGALADDDAGFVAWFEGKSWQA